MRDDEYTLLKEAAAHLKNEKTDDAALLYQKIGELYFKKNEFLKAIF